MAEIIIIAHNIRSIHNVGSIFRTSEGFGVKKIILSGYSPYPIIENDPRLPHERNNIAKQLHKTALGAETMVDFEYHQSPNIEGLKSDGYMVVALEQNDSSVNIREFIPTQKIALLLGEEVNGIEESLIAKCDKIIEIPMSGQKESFNVSVATGIALYQLTT